MDSETDATQTVVGSIESAAPRAKRQRKEADKRRARVQDLHNKYADIDFTRYQDTHADQYPPTLSMAEDASAAQGNSGAACGRIVPVKPVPTATVQHWRLWESYERNGDKSFSETEFALLCEQEVLYKMQSTYSNTYLIEGFFYTYSNVLGKFSFLF